MEEGIGCLQQFRDDTKDPSVQFSICAALYKCMSGPQLAPVNIVLYLQ